MSEKLEIFDLGGNSLGSQERDLFYSEIKKEFAEKGTITRQVKSIRLLLMNSKGRIYLQKRSKLKSENPGLYDKTVAGHVLEGHSWNVTVVRECAEELGFPAAVLSNEEFDKAITNTDLRVVGIFKNIDEINNFQSVRIDKNGNRFIQPFITAFFIGYYNGPIQFIDGESAAIEVFSIEELMEEIEKNPSRFTEDIKFMIDHYKQYLKPIK
ncbi:MAG: NUDIX domain-containing protein [Patescibacteria group bacterium]|nr:NUDIX domain-containing protein [Patescibacteria group bacterium]